MKTKPLTTAGYWDTTYGVSKKFYPDFRFCRMDYEFAHLLHPFLKNKKGASFIEMGCGCSYWLPYFGKRYGLKLAGIDFSAERLEKTKENLKRYGLWSSVLACDYFCNIPDGWRNQFDIVYSGGVIEHFESQVEVLKVFGEYLRPHGMLITTVPNMLGFWGKLGKKINQEADKGYIRLDLTQVKQFHREAGYEILYAGYFRWLDFSILNYASLPFPVRQFVTGGILLFDLILNIGTKIYLPKHLPEKYYGDMLVVAKKC